jgi:hypothetical protein
MQCQAKSKRSQQQCKKDAMINRHLCAYHGGKSLRGIAHPSFKTGVTSSYMLPLRMRDDYQTALSDPKLLELKDEIAVVQARAKDLVSRVDSGESGHLWKLLQQACEALTRAQGGAEQLAAINEMRALITRGTADYAAWTEALKTIDQKQRLVESERKRAVELHQTITLDRLNPLIYAIIDYVRRRITERDGLVEFQNILETYAGVGVAAVEGPAVDGNDRATPDASA